MGEESKFVWGEYSFHIPKCNSCKHYTGWAKCSAFPDGIPDQILEGKNNHKKPLEGQGNEFVFIPID
jgi:hypothetical protein